MRDPAEMDKSSFHCPNSFPADKHGKRHFRACSLVVHIDIYADRMLAPAYAQGKMRLSAKTAIFAVSIP